jgi:hypothetical protein
VILSGDTATLEVGRVEKVSHTFASGIDGGPVGLRLANAHTHFDDVYVKEVVSERKYYFGDGRRVAMRRDHVVYWSELDLEIPSLETPDLEASTETYGLELPTVLEAG